ncbi:hypothetical protein [Bradyrhizobium viridifuturi]|uniref:hypothetical protein n=1 Tax=Bradyrhizobium viridifuturi TaxID=1654716 RepID=UPI000AF34DC0|nr:hypothetical protein [Bradyrhizobium viridifuturi]
MTALSSDWEVCGMSAPGLAGMHSDRLPCLAFVKAKRSGPDVGAHARTAIGVTHLPLNFPVVIAAELAVR